MQLNQLFSITEIGGQELVNQVEADAKEAEICKKCKNNENKRCKECGCYECGGKELPETQLFCEECEYVTHMHCLDPPLETVPDDDWYCPHCRNDPSQIVGKGEMVAYR